MTPPTRAPLGAALLIALLLPACGDDPTDGSDGGDGTGPDGWAIATDPLDEDVVMGEASLDGTEVELADGTVVDLGEPPETFVVAGEGVYAVPVLPGLDGGADDDRFAELVLATTDGVGGTGAHPLPESLRTSPDGRYLGFIDLGEDPYAEPADAVVVDLTEGTEVVRSPDGMGEAGQDLEAVYAESDPTVFAVTEERAYVDAAGPVYSYALPSGEQTLEAEQSEDVYDTDWWEAMEAGGFTQFYRDGTGG
ncbi:hypothetical protein [Nocardioides nanhaiensis]|uniref:Uncharacterized protein n=1 Tax=Nocardioides nanhaiensis TaxID=1476871 RepID=A0ABP8VQM9_9ACTN